MLGAISVATALLIDGAAGADLADVKPGQTQYDIEHPTGGLEVEAEVDTTSQPPRVIRSGVVRTARKLFDGAVFPPEVPVTSPQHPTAQHPTARRPAARRPTSAKHPAATRPPLHDVAHLGPSSCSRPGLRESLRFFVDMMGMPRPAERATRSTCAPGMTTSPYGQAHRARNLGHPPGRVAGLEPGRARAPGGGDRGDGLGIGWKDGDPGIGPTYLFRDPDGHELELYWETEWYTPPDELKPSLKNQAQAYPGRGLRPAAGPR